MDQRDAGRCIERLHAVDVDAVLTKQRKRRSSERVAAHGAVQGDHGPGAARGQRLIGAPAAGARRKIESVLCPPARGRCGTRAGEIEIDRAEDNDHRPLRQPVPGS